MRSKVSRLCLPALLALAVLSPAAAAPPKSYLQLGARSREFTRALVAGESWKVYQMFVPQFREEISFARFDSALSDWYDGRHIARTRSRVIRVNSLTGHASTWPVFEGERDYSYVYQNWFFDGRDWSLIWLSNILNPSFRYGQADTAAITEAARTALRYVATPEGIARVLPGLKLPDTLVVVWRLTRPDTDFSVPGHTVVMLPPEENHKDGPASRVPIYLRIAAIRILGEYATCAVDFVPTPLNRFRDLRNIQSVVVCLESRDDRWRVHSVAR